MPTTDEPQASSNPRNLAANFRHMANLIESGSLNEFPTPVHLSVIVSAFGDRAEHQKTMVDQFASVTGQKPAFDAVSGGSRYAYYRTELKAGRAWSLAANAFVPRPDPVAELRAENERLRAELAARDGVPA